MIGIYATHDEINLFMKRADSDKDGRVSYSEFCRLLLSVDPYYANLVTSRESNKIASYYRDDCFSFSTRMYFKELWRAFFKNEGNSEHLRIRLAKDPIFDV